MYLKSIENMFNDWMIIFMSRKKVTFWLTKSNNTPATVSPGNTPGNIISSKHLNCCNPENKPAILVLLPRLCTDADVENSTPRLHFDAKDGVFLGRLPVKTDSLESASMLWPDLRGRVAEVGESMSSVFCLCMIFIIS